MNVSSKIILWTGGNQLQSWVGEKSTFLYDYLIFIVSYFLRYNHWKLQYLRI